MQRGHLPRGLGSRSSTRLQARETGASDTTRPPSGQRGPHAGSGSESTTAETVPAREERAWLLEERARALDQREVTLAAHEASAAEAESALHLREETSAERARTTAAVEAAMAQRAEELHLREEAWWECDVALTGRESEVARREVAARRLGDQLAKREEDVTGREGRHMESAAMAEWASELEAKEKELALREQRSGADLADRLAAAQDALAALERLVQDHAGEIGALCLANDVGPGLLQDSIKRRRTRSFT